MFFVLGRQIRFDAFGQSMTDFQSRNILLADMEGTQTLQGVVQKHIFAPLQRESKACLIRQSF